MLAGSNPALTTMENKDDLLFEEKVRELLDEAIKNRDGAEAHRWGRLLMKDFIVTPRRRWHITPFN